MRELALTVPLALKHLLRECAIPGPCQYRRSRSHILAIEKTQKWLFVISPPDGRVDLKSNAR